MGRYSRSGLVIHEHGFTINGCRFNVDSKYQPIRAIGQGSYGVVCSVRNTQTNEKLAIKKITPMADDEWDATHTLREIRLLRWLGVHENIISLKDLSMCKEEDELYMVMELADTDLHRLIQSSCLLTEGHVRVIMYQILSGVKAMHDNGILHRDLKPGNLLLNKDCKLKVTDFGLARMMPKKSQSGLQPSDDGISMMTEYVVTRWYRPPELMLAPSGSYDGAVDMWSIGCIFGELVSRKPLFPGTDFIDQLKRVFQVLPIPEPEDRGYVIGKGALKFLSSLCPPAPGALEDKLGETAGPQALDLLRRLLSFNPKKRISADDALAHPFFEGIRDEWGKITPLHLPHSLELAFETESLSLATLRQHICDEVLAFANPLTNRLPEPQQSEPQATKIEKAGVPNESAADSNGTPLALKNDCPPGSGFTLKGHNFNVPAKYKPLRVLVGDSDGIVCASTDTETKRNVAIKKITPMAGDEGNARQTLREIRLMRYFSKHPNIASLENLSTCIKKDELYLMMDLADTDLQRLIRSKTKLGNAHIAAIMYQLLCGAQTLHENGVLHRNLKPGNILVSKDCDVKITDFGRSRYISPSDRASPTSDQEGQQPRHTVDKTQSLMTEYVVTCWYRPPEIMLAPTSIYNEAVDMWSIGCIFGELLNRRPMFPGADFVDQLSRVFGVLSVSPRNKLGYEVEDDALAFLESLPPCSPSTLDKLFHHASPEAVSLLQRLLCVNPARRISAKQALAHPYFTTIRAQLGEPPVFRPEEIFEFEFDDQEFLLTHLKALIQSEVKLLQNNGLSPSTPVHEPIEDAEQQPEDFDDTAKQSENYDNDNDDSDDDVHVQEADSLATKRGVRHGHCEEAKQTNTTRDRRDTYGPTGPEDDSEVLVVDECEQASSNSESGITKHPRQHQQQEDEEIEAISRKKQLATAKVDTQDNDDDKIVNVAKRSENSTVSSLPLTPIAHALASAVASRQTSSTTTVTTTISCSLARPKNAETTTCRNLTTSSGSAKSRSTSDGISYSSQQDSHDGEKVSSIASTSSNNQHYQNSSNSLDFIEFRGKWSHPQSRAMAPTASSRLHRSTAHIASVSLIHKRSERRSEPVKIAPTTTRFGVLWTSSSNNNQLRSPGTESIDRDSVKSDAPRGPERLSSTITAATASSRRRRSSTTSTVRQISSARKKSLEGRICQTHPESRRQHFYKSLNKVAWKMPAKPQHLDNISPSTSDSSAPSSYVAYDHSRSHVVLGTSSISSSPTNALPLEYPTVLLSRQSGSGTISNLPKEWVRRTDPKTRRLFYVNLVSYRSYATLPCSVTVAMLNLGREAVIRNKRVAAKATIDRKKATVPRSPKFTQMSWQRKKSHATKG